jgi:hypothetical protein
MAMGTLDSDEDPGFDTDSHGWDLFPMTGLSIASLAAAQALAEYVAIAGRGALGKIQGMVSQTSNWIDSHTDLVWVAVALLVLFWWLTRRK